MLALNCAAHKPSAMMENAMLNNHVLNSRTYRIDCRLQPVIDRRLNSGNPAIVQHPEAGQ